MEVFIMAELTIVNVFQNVKFKNVEELTVNEQSLLLNYLLFWNWKGRDNNSITPRNKLLQKQMGVSENTYYKARKGLKEKGFIVVETQKFNKKGKQKPAVIRLAEWIIKSNKVAVDTQQSVQKTEQKEVPEVRTNANKPISVAELEEYGKNLAAQIGAKIAVYPRQLERIKKYEAKTSKEVIKLVRDYVNKHSNSNPWTYYEATLEDLIKNHVENLSDLEKYNPKLAGKTFKAVQQQLPIMTVVNGKKSVKTSYKPTYIRGKRVEQGTDWSKKKAKILTDEENDIKARKYLGLTKDQEWPAEYAELSPSERFSRSLKESFKKMEEKTQLTY